MKRGETHRGDSIAGNFVGEVVLEIVDMEILSFNVY